MHIIEPLSTTKTQVQANLKQPVLNAPLNQKMPLVEIKVYQNQQLLRSFEVNNQVTLEKENIFKQWMAWCHDLWHGIQRKANIKL